MSSRVFRRRPGKPTFFKVPKRRRARVVPKVPFKPSGKRPSKRTLPGISLPRSMRLRVRLERAFSHPQAGSRNVSQAYLDRFKSACTYPVVLRQYLAVDELERMPTNTADNFINLAGILNDPKDIRLTISLLRAVVDSDLHPRVKRTAGRTLRHLERKLSSH